MKEAFSKRGGIFTVVFPPVHIGYVVILMK